MFGLPHASPCWIGVAKGSCDTTVCYYEASPLLSSLTSCSCPCTQHGTCLNPISLLVSCQPTSPLNTLSSVPCISLPRCSDCPMHCWQMPLVRATLRILPTDVALTMHGPSFHMVFISICLRSPALCDLF